VVVPMDLDRAPEQSDIGFGGNVRQFCGHFRISL
jgi:hypothetical protein